MSHNTFTPPILSHHIDPTTRGTCSSAISTQKTTRHVPRHFRQWYKMIDF